MDEPREIIPVEGLLKLKGFSPAIDVEAADDEEEEEEEGTESEEESEDEDGSEES